MKNYSIRMRILTGMLILLVVALIPPFYFFDSSIRDDLVLDTKNRATSSLETVHWMMHERGAFADAEELHHWASNLGERMGIRITYIIDGVVIADSDVAYSELSSLDKHDKRPEVVSARQGDTGLEVRYSTTLQKDLVYAARYVSDVFGIQDGVLRIAIPVSQVTDRLNRLESGMLWVFVLTIMGTVFIGYMGTRPLLRSIEALARAAQAIGQGQYSRRIRVYPGKELKPLVDAINGMAHNIEQHLSMLVDQKGRLEAIFDGMNEGVMVLDGNGRLHSTNRALEGMFPGISGKMGRTPMEATMKPELQHLVERISEQSAEENRSESQKIATQIEITGGRHLEVTLVPFVMPDGSSRAVLVFYDISERERLEKVRRDFVANVSHELKTPLTSIKGYAETLIESPPAKPEQMKAFLKTILKNANHMTKMVNSLLVLARSQHKGEQTDLIPVDAIEIMRQSINDVLYAAKARNITIENGLPDSTSIVLGDKDGLLEVFRNLLDNAVKYSPEDSTIHVSVRHTKGVAAFCVRDEGPGVPANARERIFERFFRIEHDPESAAKNGSAGLGLAICRRIVKSHGGDIWVESPLDPETETGAAFFVTLQAPHTGEAS